MDKIQANITNDLNNVRKYNSEMFKDIMPQTEIEELNN